MLSLLQKRREQNRQSQRAFRERKESQFRQMEANIAAVISKNEELVSECQSLRDECVKLLDAQRSFREDFMAEAMLHWPLFFEMTCLRDRDRASSDWGMLSPTVEDGDMSKYLDQLALTESSWLPF